MQAPDTLQRQSLESIYTFLEGLTAFVESIESKLAPDERLQARNLRDLAALCCRKLIAAFPEPHSWLGEMTRGGGR